MVKRNRLKSGDSRINFDGQWSLHMYDMPAQYHRHCFLRDMVKGG